MTLHGDDVLIHQLHYREQTIEAWQLVYFVPVHDPLSHYVKAPFSQLWACGRDPDTSRLSSTVTSEVAELPECPLLLGTGILEG